MAVIEDPDSWRDVLQSAASNFVTPFYLLRLPVYAKRVAELDAALKTELGGCTIRHWYSYKTLPVPHFAASANRDHGIGIEVTSAFEFHSVLAAGVPASNILVNGPCKHLWLPRDCRGLTVAFDSLHEVREFAQVSGALGWDVGLRLSLKDQRDPDDERFPAQFGIPRQDLYEAIEILREARNPPSFIHFHLRGNVSTEILAAAAAEAAQIVNAFGSRLQVKVINFGGGLPEPNVVTNGVEHGKEMTFVRYAKIVAACRKAFPTTTEAWFENGRTLVGPAGALVVTVGDIKQIEGHRILICDGGRTNNALESDWGSHLVQPIGVESSVSAPTIVCGPSCMPYDWIYRGPFPSAVARGTKIAYFNAGAYHIPWETRFSRGLCAVVLEDMIGRLRLIRHPESTSEWASKWELDGMGQCG